MKETLNECYQWACFNGNVCADGFSEPMGSYYGDGGGALNPCLNGDACCTSRSGYRSESIQTVQGTVDECN